MITISLDEYGEFEKDDNKPLFIAGVIFDDTEQPDDIHIEDRIERDRIRAYYKKVIEEAGEGFSYPQDLHSNGNWQRDHNVVRPVKQKVAETLGEFISKGTYQGNALCYESGNKIQDRKGKYHLFVMLKSDDGKKNLLKESANMLANDDWGANRYFHMASSVVNRIIFHNPIYKNGELPAVNIDIATRSTGHVEDMDVDLVEEFKRQAYKTTEINNGDYRFYSIMNADIYRTLIAQEMVNTGNVGVKIEKLFVKSIQYTPNKPMMEYLYLSDSLCSLLGYKLTGTSADDWLEQIKGRVQELNSNVENLIFGYDEIDNDFSKAWKCYEQKNIFDALSISYDAKMKKGKFAEHYKNIWFPYLEERIKETVTPDIFNRSINNLSSLLVANNLDQEKLLYLLLQFEDMVERISKKIKSQDWKASLLCKLYDAGVSAFCHIGNPSKALEYYEKCKQYAFYIGIDAFLKTTNKLIVCYEDSFEWDKAIEIATENVANHELISELKRDILKVSGEQAFLDEAKAISQLARIYAEKRDEQAEILFKEALSKLEAGSANYKITQSYLLHFYADMNMKEAYDEESRSYFNKKNDFKKRLKFIINTKEETHSVFSNEYAFYVLIRGLYCFHKDEIDDELWETLCNLDEILTSKDKDKKAPSGHPWEITYKYLEMLAINRKDSEARKKFARLKREKLKYRGEILEAIDMFGAAEVAELEKDIEKRNIIVNDLVEYLKHNFVAVERANIPTEPEERYIELKKYFTFMFH